MRSEAVYISGSGIISAIGLDKTSVLVSLSENRSGIGPVKYLHTTHKELPVGEVRMTDAELAAPFQKPPFNLPVDRPQPRTALLGMWALREALSEAGLSAADLPKVGFISGTTVGGMDLTERHYVPFSDEEELPDYWATHNCGVCTEMTAEPFGKFAFMTTVSTACSSAANALIMAAELIKRGEADIVVAGGSECLTGFHLNGFNALMILDDRPCRPFDADRAGLNLGEGAAYVVLESAASVRRRGIRPLARLAGYGNTCDAFHQTASSENGEGAFLAIEKTLKMAGIPASAVDYINAHGTGTPNNDASESVAIKRVFGETIPPVSSTKAFTGHTTSASGAIEAVICLLALRHQFIPVNLHWQRPMPEGIRPATAGRPSRPVEQVLCHSFGFGGNTSALLLSRVGAEPLVDTAGTLTDTVVDRTVRSVYVGAAAQISMQTPLSEDWMRSPRCFDGQSYVPALDPDFKTFLSSLEARRMGKLLKRAVAVTETVLQASGTVCPDAVITGTGGGCMARTRRFLDALYQNGEQLLPPTDFMQSTHNTIGSLIGMRTKSHGYNATYAHEDISFDSALLDAWTQMQLGCVNTALVGGYDEGRPFGRPDRLCGETAVAVLLQASPERAWCRLWGCKMLYAPSAAEAKEALTVLLRAAGTDLAGVDAVMTGLTGHPVVDQTYGTFLEPLFPDVPVLRYKHMFGESYTASGLGFYAAACCLKYGEIPAFLQTDAVSSNGVRPLAGRPSSQGNRQLRRMLVCHMTGNKYYTLSLLESCGR